MRILAVSDEESPYFWEYYLPGRLAEFDLILACGDLKAEYLSFLVTMARCPVLYVHGNHDGSYRFAPPEGCDCIDGRLVEYRGLRILGLGGCRKYHPGPFQYTEADMRRRIRKLRFALWKSKGVDIVVSHAPVEGLGDGEDSAHKGFAALRKLVDKYRPTYLLHGHVHLRYGTDRTRVREYAGTTIINVSERYVLEIPERAHPRKDHDRLIWKTRYQRPYPEDFL